MKKVPLNIRVRSSQAALKAGVFKTVKTGTLFFRGVNKYGSDIVRVKKDGTKSVESYAANFWEVIPIEPESGEVGHGEHVEIMREIQGHEPGDEFAS